MRTDFYSFALDTLDHPDRLWQHAFEYQLGGPERSLLLVLATFPGEIFLASLSAALESYDPVAIQPGDAAVSRSLKILEGTFTRTQGAATGIAIGFRNPSVRDFLHGVLSRDASTLRRLVESSVYFEQTEYLMRLRALDEERMAAKSHVVSAPREYELDALKRTFGAPAAVVRDLAIFRRHFVRVPVSADYERRAVFVIEKSQGTVDAEWLTSALAFLAGRWSAHEGSATGVVLLLRAIGALPSPYQATALPFLEVAKAWFFSRLLDSSDFMCARDFVDAAPPGLVMEGELASIESRFHEYLDEAFDALWDHDDDEFVDAFVTLKDALTSFGIEDERLSAAEEHVEELESSGEGGDGDPNAYTDDEETAREEEDAEIASLFHLLEE